MKKKPKRFIAIAALTAIAALIISYVISAFFADTADGGRRFLGLLFGIIAVPILAWLLIFCIEKLPDKKDDNDNN